MGLCALAAAGVSSCKNADTDFPDSESGTTAYFAYQYPVRTIVLGEDKQYPNPTDNDYQFNIYATHGGSYESRNPKINVAIDRSLVDNLYFEDGSPVQAMPESYFSMESTTLKKHKDFYFGTTITLTDAFFADPNAIKNTYVVPVIITDAVGVDRVITGTPVTEGTSPSRTNSAAWSVQPKDFTLYCVKFVNKYHANYTRHGVDQITENGSTRTNVRHNQYVEKDEIVSVTTRSLTSCIFPVSTTIEVDGAVQTRTCDLLLSFNGDDCTITSATEGMAASGTGKFVKDGEKKTYNNEDHDAIYLNYQIDFGGKQYDTTDTLTLQVRGIAGEWFKPTYKN